MANMLVWLNLTVMLLFHLSAFVKHTAVAEEFRISPQQYQDAQDAFDMLDNDGDGKVSITDLGSIFRLLGYELGGEKLQQVEAWAEDEGGTELVTRETFKTIFELTVRMFESEQFAREIFRVVDKRMKGFIPLEDFEFFLLLVGDYLTAQEIEAVIMETDRDSSGTIDYMEFFWLLFSS